MSDKIQTYTEFWPYYLQEHSNPICRALHYAGTTLALISIVLLVFTLSPWYIVSALVGGYGFAWFAHFFVEKNRPATFTYPVWSLISDFRMYFYWISGKLGNELEKADVAGVQTR